MLQQSPTNVTEKALFILAVFFFLETQTTIPFTVTHSCPIDQVNIKSAQECAPTGNYYSDDPIGGTQMLEVSELA